MILFCEELNRFVTIPHFNWKITQATSLIRNWKHIVSQLMLKSRYRLRMTWFGDFLSSAHRSRDCISVKWTCFVEARVVLHTLPRESFNLALIGNTKLNYFVGECVRRAIVHCCVWQIAPRILYGCNCFAASVSVLIRVSTRYPYSPDLQDSIYKLWSPHIYSVMYIEVYNIRSRLCSNWYK